MRGLIRGYPTIDNRFRTEPPLTRYPPKSESLLKRSLLKRYPLISEHPLRTTRYPLSVSGAATAYLAIVVVEDPLPTLRPASLYHDRGARVRQRRHVGRVHRVEAHEQGRAKGNGEGQPSTDAGGRLASSSCARGQRFFFIVIQSISTVSTDGVQEYISQKKQHTRSTKIQVFRRFPEQHTAIVSPLWATIWQLTHHCAWMIKTKKPPIRHTGERGHQFGIFCLANHRVKIQNHQSASYSARAQPMSPVFRAARGRCEGSERAWRARKGVEVTAGYLIDRRQAEGENKSMVNGK